VTKTSSTKKKQITENPGREGGEKQEQDSPAAETSERGCDLEGSGKGERGEGQRGESNINGIFLKTFHKAAKEGPCEWKVLQEGGRK